MFNDSIKINGKVRIKIKRANGNVEITTIDNLVIKAGRDHIADQLVGQLQGPMSYMAVGEGTTTQIPTDTALESEISRHAFTTKTQGAGADAHKVEYIGDWGAGEAQGAITEAGIFNAVSGGVMLCRTTFPVKNIEAGDALAIQWTLTING
jgi:hypothetical protein